MKNIRETSAGKTISASVIMKDATFIGKVLAHYGVSGVVKVEVWGVGELLHRGHAGGGGYDKYTAALSGAVIDGHKITDHCAVRLPVPDCGYFADDFDKPLGYAFANWDANKGGYADCYKQPGLRYLEDLGYTIISVI